MKFKEIRFFSEFKLFLNNDSIIFLIDILKKKKLFASQSLYWINRCFSRVSYNGHVVFLIYYYFENRIKVGKVWPL